MTHAFTFRFEDREIEARPGQSLAAALLEAGEAGLRETRTGGLRGLYCGMGVCQECLVRVEKENQPTEQVRACMTPAQPGLLVTRGRFLAETDVAGGGAPPIGLTDLPEEAPEVLVVGGGAGGLAAALAARQAGCDVLLLDERKIPGGQYYKQAAGAPTLDAQQREGEALVAAADRAGVRRWQGAEVWGAFAPDLLLAHHEGATWRLRPQVLILATGAYERPWPVPGWTLPGVMTTGAAQTLWRSQRTLPGRRVVVAGAGPLNLQVAWELSRGGAEIVAVAEAAPPPAPSRWRAGARLIAAGPRLAATGLAQIAALRSAGTRVRWGMQVTRIEASPGGLRATLDGAGGRETFEADAVALGYGFLPANEMARALGVRHEYDPVRGHLVCVRGPDMQTSVPNVFAVGDGCGLGGAPAAREEGVIAGLAAAKRLGREGSAAEAGAAARRLVRHRRFQDALWSVFSAPRVALALADADTLICRCEEVTRAALDACMSEGTPDLAEIKRRTRIGMGRCGGRTCGPLLAEHLAAVADRPLDEVAGFAPRAPVKPIRIADIVGTGAKP